MVIVLGATGQVGSHLVKELLKRNEKVRIAVRNEEKALAFKEKGAQVFIADYTDVPSLKKAFDGCDTAFLITPENPFSNDYPAEADAMLACYREAVLSAGINTVIGLSSMGAQHNANTGNLVVSHKLENLFSDTQIKTSYIRPAYYFSNWMGYFDMAKETGILPSFFPSNLKIHMIAPYDVAFFAANIITQKIDFQPIYEIYNEYYCAKDIAKAMSLLLNKEIAVDVRPENKWISTLKQVGFSNSCAYNFALMTKAVVDGKTQAETELLKLPTDFQNYLNGFSNK